MFAHMIQLRTKTLAYVALFLTFIYFWYHLSNLHDGRLNSYHSSYVNFKHLLIACILAAQKGGVEVKRARSNLEVKVKGKTKEGVLDVLTTGDKMSNLMMVNSLLYTFPKIKVISEEHTPASDDVFPLDVNQYLSNDEFIPVPNDIYLKVDDLVIWIDPLDATKEYSEGLTQYVTTMVCVARHGEPLIGVIHQPFSSQTYWASKFGIDKKLLSLRSSHSGNQSDWPRIVISRSHKGDVERLIHSTRLNFTITQAAGSGFKVLELVRGAADIYLHKTYIKKWDICAPNAIVNYATDGTMVTLKEGAAIDYSFDSDSVNRHGLFATVNPKLVHLRNVIADKVNLNA